MKIILVSIGTRGDMEPFLAIGDILREYGQEVICAFPEQFRNLADDANMEFASLGEKYIEMLESDVGRTALGAGGSGITKFLATLKLAQNQTEANKEMIHCQYEIVERENPDRIIYNGKSVYPIIWGLEHPEKNILICPLPYIHYVKNHTHVAFNGNFGPFNRLTYSLADFGLVTTVKICFNWLQLKRKISRGQISDALRSNKAIYTISPSLFSRPDDWPEKLQVLGFHDAHPSNPWQPDENIIQFIDRHKDNHLLLVTFGSMTNPEPEVKTEILLAILQKHHIPAIINKAAGGLIEPDQYDTNLFHIVSSIPYDWVLPQVYGVIHHGGSGTTHLALQNGCATMIIPHIIDQFVWNKIVADLGAGPRGIKIGKMTASNLEPIIVDLVGNPSYKMNAERIADQMGKEDFREAIARAILDY